MVPQPPQKVPLSWELSTENAPVGDMPDSNHNTLGDRPKERGWGVGGWCEEKGSFAHLLSPGLAAPWILLLTGVREAVRVCAGHSIELPGQRE